jgi:IS30 family transposase
MGAQYTQLTLEERERIYGLKEQGKSFREIAKVLDRNHRTVAREYKRNRYAGQEYIPCKAEKISVNRGVQQRSKAPLKNVETFLYVREKLRVEQWSPERIAGRITIDHPYLSICQETIYQYIYGRGKKYKLEKYLRKRHKRRREKTGRSAQREKSSSRIPDAVMIDKRITKANNRTQVGHFETDLMEGSRGTKTALSVTVERKTRYTIISKVSNKQAHIKEKVLTKRLQTLQSLSKSNKPIVRSITSDNGSENTNHKQVSQTLGVAMYFCHPYHSWEKGSVENRIGFIRQYIPKGTGIHHYSEKQIQWLENKLNNTPMKCLGFLTPTEALLKEVNRYKFKKYISP